MMEVQKIDIERFILNGGGANGESYTSREDPGMMLKLYFPGMERQALNELQRSHMVFDAGIPVPEPGQYVVTEDGRYGILFKRIPDKVSIARAVGDNPQRVTEYAVRFADMCKQLHATKVDTSTFCSVKEHYLEILKDSVLFTPEQKKKIEDFIREAPESDTAIHGDLQFGNAIISGEESYFIDLGDFCYGHPFFDLGMVLLTCKLGKEEFTKDVFHMDAETSGRFWEAFAAEYFGKDVPLEEIEAEILPYSALKTIIIERDCGFPKPEFRELLEKTIL
ncbi:MAG: phosphotransferase [Bacteroidales bacterium]|nr:phosphotransferase [Bacteroidales bacterium]